MLAVMVNNGGKKYAISKMESVHGAFRRPGQGFR